MDQTYTMFQIIYSENHEVGQTLRLRICSESLAGWASSIAADEGGEDAYVKEVLSQAEKFHQTIQNLIQDLQDGYGEDPCILPDLKILREMQGWTYDPIQLEKLAREDWQEHHTEPTEADA